MRWCGLANEPAATELRARAARHPGAAWVIGNEPNTSLQDNLSPPAYAAFFDRVVTAIRAGDSSARIVAPNTLNFDFRCRGCAGDDLTGREWIDGFRAAYRELRGTEPPIDIWGIHAYEIDWIDPPMTDVSVMQAQLEGLRAYLDSIPEQRGRPIWLTEFAIIWGYDDWRFTEGPDGELLVAPAGRFRADLVEQIPDRSARLAGNARPPAWRGALVRIRGPRSPRPDLHHVCRDFVA